MSLRRGLTWCVIVGCFGCSPAVGGAGGSSGGSDEASASEPETSETDPGETSGTGGFGSSTGDPGFETDAVTETDDPVGCDAWTYSTILDDAGSFSATDIAAFPGVLVLAGTPSSDAVSLADTAGELLWSHPLARNSEVLFLLDVLALGGENILVGGSRLPSGGAETNAWLAHLEADGTLVWQADLGEIIGSAWGHFDVAAHPAGGYVLSATGGDNELRAVRISAEGESSWSESVPSGGTVAINWSHGAMDVLPSGDIVQLTASDDGLRVVRRHEDGTLAWRQDFATGTWPQDILGLPNEDAFVLSYDSDTTVLTRIDAEGTELWSERYAHGSGSAMSAMAWDADAQRLFVGGETRGIEGPNSTWARTWLLMLDGDGGLRWEHVGEPGSPSMPLDIHVDPAAHRFVFTSHAQGLFLGEVSGEPCD